MKVLNDQQTLLRVMRVASEGDAVLQRARVFQNPQLTKMGLLDSEATHALRQERLGEASTARSVKVTLANDQKTTLLQNAQGVLLGQERDAQPILVKQLAYTFEWNARGCRLHHPEKESAQVFTRSSCPEVRECDALRLIAEIEGMKVEEARKTLKELTTTMKSTRVGADGNLRGPSRDWRSYVKDYLKTGRKEDITKAVMDASFMKDVPDKDRLAIFEHLPDGDKEAWQAMKQLPLTRARRKRLWKSNRWMVHLFSGKEKEGDPLRRWDGARPSGLEELVYLEVDLARDKAWNVAGGPLYKVLLWAASKGKIEGIFGGPPCRSYSLLRFREVPGLNLPRPVRSVQEPWGKSRGLTVEEETLVHNDNKLILRMVWLWLVAEEGKRKVWGYDTVGGSKVAFALEHPEDPREFLPRGDLYEQCASFWRTALARELSHGSGLALLTCQFDQGHFGHDQRKPTKVLSNMDMANLDQMRDPRTPWEKPRTSSDMAAWAPGFRAILAQGLREWQGQSIVQVAAMSPEREALWKEHIRQGHWPYRRDCRVCVEAAASGKPARKVVHRDACVLSMDTAGPFKEKGMDENGEKYKYVLGFTYLFLKTFSVAAEAEIPDEVEDFEMDEYVPSEAEQEEEGESGEQARMRQNGKRNGTSCSAT